MKRILLVAFMVLGLAVPAFCISQETLMNRVYNPSSNTLRLELKDITNTVTSATNDRQTVAPEGFTSIVSEDTTRKYLKIHNLSPDSGVYISLAAPADAVDKSGLFLNEISNDSSSWWEMPTNAIYTGEVSARSVSDEVELTILSY